MTTQHERRQFWRAHFHSPVRLEVTGQVITTEILDISLKGAMVKIPDGWAGHLGDRVQLQLDLAAEAKISMNATVAHIKDSRVGLHCDSIDLDSVTHLRRLIELNSGDPDQLDRELSTLLRETD